MTSHTSDAIDNDTTTILIVEDNPIFLEQLSDAAKRISPTTNILSATSGADYRETIQNIDVLNLALIDLGLPDIDGIEIIRDLQKRSSQTVILVISVITNQDTVIAAIRAGARGYILKGEPTDSIANAIADVMAGNYPISPAIARYLFRLAGKEQAIQEAAIELTSREEETLKLIAAGCSYSDAAAKMGVSLSTVQTYIRNLYRKLGAHSQVQAVNKARQAGFID